MVSKIIQIEFADPRIKAIDYIHDIREAAKNAGLNLYSRYDVQLQYPRPDGDRVVVEIKIPDDKADDFKIGNHLRGISNYLLSRWNDRYHPYLIGNRLLYYNEIDELDSKESELMMVDRLEAIALFAKLLERKDDEAMDKINQILTILKEA